MLTNVHMIKVEWGDCDPAGIVFYPNYYRWMDEATWRLFARAGLTWERFQEDYGAPGMPLVSTHADFRAPSFFNDGLGIESHVSDIGTKSLTVVHTFTRKGKTVVEGWEKRIWCIGNPGKDGKVVTAPIPEQVKTLLACGIGVPAFG